jgi:hypothetical protein
MNLEISPKVFILTIIPMILMDSTIIYESNWHFSRNHIIEGFSSINPSATKIPKGLPQI